jgi:N-sulfoglucosamine sulfohydrolase
MKHHIIIALASLALPLLSFADTEQRPNVLLITADDMGWDSLGCTGNTMSGISPNLDTLASEGILIEHCFISTPICGPSRESLYTGQFPQTSGYMGHGVQPPTWWENAGGTRPSTSITTELKNAGYFTGCVGKHGSTACRFSMAPRGAPHETGLGRDPAKYYEFVREFLGRAKEEGKPFYLAANAHDPHHYWARSRGENPNWFKAMMHNKEWTPYPNGKPYPDPQTEYTPADCVVPPAYPNDSRFKAELSNYYDSVNRMDEVVGGVLKALDESGQADNTIVIFLSDHGMPWAMSKWALYPSGTKTPLIIRWPSKIQSELRNADSVVSVVDIAPTIAALCGLPVMEQVDGMTFAELLSGNTADWNRRAAFSCFNYMNNARELDEAIEAYPSDLYQQMEQYRPSRALNTTRYTYVWNGWADGETEQPRTMGSEVTALLRKNANKAEDSAYPNYAERADFILQRVPEELYDVKKDPGCLNNLARNPEYHAVLKSFQKNMQQLLEETDDHELNNYTEFVDVCF